MQHPNPHEILLFVLQVGVLLALARLFGEAARRLGQPEVVGELLAGVVAGPSALGVVLPALQRSLFPADALRGGPLGAAAEVGLVLLLVITGFETDLGPVARRGRPAVLTVAGGVALPFACGLGLASLVPASLAGARGGDGAFALFIATALCISALPVLAKILLDLRLIRRDLGRLAMAAGALNDAAGWILLCAVAGIAAAPASSPASAALQVAGTLAAAALAVRFAPHAFAAVLRWADGVTGGARAATLATVVLLALGGAALTQAAGLQPFVGAFAAGVALGRLPRARRARARIEAVTLGCLTPLFFAVAGLGVDLPRLLAPAPLLALAALVAVAVASKAVGAYLGARVASLPHGTALNLGVGLTARGAAGAVVAAVGLSLGVLGPVPYTALVVMAVVTSVATPPLLRRTLGTLPPDPDEGRTAAEDRRAAGAWRGLRRILVPERGGENARTGARLASYVAMRRGAEVTTLHVTRMSAARIGPAWRSAAGRGGSVGPAGSAGPAGAVGPGGSVGPGALGGRTAVPLEGRAVVRPAGAAPYRPTGPAPVSGAGTGTAAAAARDRGSGATAHRPGAGGAPPYGDPCRQERAGPAVRAAAAGAPPAVARRTLTAAGPPATTILKEVHRGYDLLVLGASEIGRTREALFGSVVDAVLRLAPCATLVVRAGRRSGGALQRILLPTRGDADGLRAAELAVDIAAGCGATVTALHVVEARNPSPDARRHIRAGYAAVDAVVAMGSAAGVAVEGRVALARRAGAEILRVAAAGGFDLIVMRGHLRRAGRRMLYGRTVARVLRHPACDVALLSALPARG